MGRSRKGVRFRERLPLAESGFNEFFRIVRPGAFLLNLVGRDGKSVIFLSEAFA
jgi:hypothetical protein